MDDLTSFEDRMAHDALRVAGPPRPVDAAAVFAAVDTERPRWSLGPFVGAGRVAFAATVVALFGGFLAAGFLATQPDGAGLPGAGASVAVSPQPMPITLRRGRGARRTI